jgi:hypothetical protein
MHSFPVSLRAVHKANELPIYSETENHQRYKAAINDKTELQIRFTNPLINDRGLLYNQFRRAKTQGA